MVVSMGAVSAGGEACGHTRFRRSPEQMTRRVVLVLEEEDLNITEEEIEEGRLFGASFYDAEGAEQYIDNVTTLLETLRMHGQHSARVRG